jgi:micrococcal nuclease
MKYRKIASIIFVVVVVCVLIGIFAYKVSAISIDPYELYQVTHVLDGDTFKVKVGWHEVTVRMLGIDTPETVDKRKPVQCYGKEASDQTKELLSGSSVRLELNPDREEKDRYGRYLAYVRRADDLFVNEFLLQNGYAREYTYGRPYLRQNEFRGVESMAKDAGVGLWGACPEIIKAKK